MAFQFKPIGPNIWTGRYSRIPGESSVLHVRSVLGALTTVVYLTQQDSTATCVALESAAVQSLTGAVSSAKQRLSGHLGGSFQINEYGQVLVPASRGRRRMIVGEVFGELQFQDPLNDGAVFSLNKADGFAPGDSWPRPYVGMPFNLSGRSQIYFWMEADDGGRLVRPPVQDRNLIQALRGVRRSGPIRFIVGPGGIVLTKRPPDGRWTGDQEVWRPVYVGRLDFSKWFPRED